MRNITAQILAYREAARHLWNAFLWKGEASGALTSHAALHDWEALKQLLFTTLVLRASVPGDRASILLGEDRLGLSWLDPIGFLKVVPRVECPVMISREPGRGGYWDHPIGRLGPGDADLRFIDFFDWDQSGFLDFQYYLVAIESSVPHAALAGHRALVEVQYADVFIEVEEA